MATEIPAPNEAQAVLLAIKEVQHFSTPSTVNKYLELGWVLLATTNQQDGGAQWVQYALGWPNALPAAEPPNAGFL